MIILYDKDTVEFGQNLGLGVLRDAVTCEVSEEINETYELEMTYPYEGQHTADLIIDNIIYTNVNPFEDKMQAFRIYSVSKPINGILTIEAQHISYDATKLIINPANLSNKEKAILDQSLLNEAKNAVIANADIKNRYTITLDSSYASDKTADISYTAPASLRYFLANQIISGYNVELEFDNFTTTIVEKRGSDRGVVINYGKNIEDLEETKSSNTSCVAIFPYYWKSSSTTSSGVNYVYQSLKEDTSLIPQSYDWLYSESTSSGVVGKIKSLITSSIKSYIFKNETTSNLYMWDTYSYVNVSDIDDWEMASDSNTTSSISSQVFNVLDNIVPISSIISAFSKSKEKMKAALSVFQLYYNAYSQTSNYSITKTPVAGEINVNSYTFSLNDVDQNLTNITIYGDSSYGTKSVRNTVMDNACFIKIGDTRLYCGYQENTNLYYNNFLYVGPKSGVVSSLRTFFEATSGEWNINDTFISNKYLVLIYNAKDSSYSNTIFIPRVKDTIENVDDVSEYEPWSVQDVGHHIYYAETDEGNRQYKYYDDGTRTTPPSPQLRDLSSSTFVYPENKWSKIMTVKGLDPAYPSTSGETTTKTEKALLKDLGTFYVTNPYTNNANIIMYQKSYWLYSENNWISNESINIETNETRLFIINESTTKYYTFRGGSVQDYPHDSQIESEQTIILTVKKLPTSDIATNALYIKDTSGASKEYYIREGSKWVKLTLTSAKTNTVYIYTNNNVTAYYKSDFTSLTVDSKTYDDPDNLPQGGSNKLCIVKMTNSNLDPYSGCIFLDKSYINNSNILIQPVDLTSLVDEKNDELFTGIDLESTVTVNTQKAGKLLLDFIKQYYITEEDNNPNVLTNETTLTYMRITDDNQLLDYLALNKVLIGDTIHIRYGKLGISSDLRVKAITYDVLSMRYTDITLGELTETLASSVVTTSDGISILANDSGYANQETVNKIIAKSITSDYVSAQTFESTNAIISTLDVEQLNAVTAKIESIITEPLSPNPTSEVKLSGTIVTSIDGATLSPGSINYHTDLSYTWDDTTRTLTIDIG